jgi:hypothetical protein
MPAAGGVLANLSPWRRELDATNQSFVLQGRVAEERSLTTPATYKEYAADCLTAMRAAMLPEVKALLLAMAQQWNEFAERAERRRVAQADATSPSIADQD